MNINEYSINLKSLISNPELGYYTCDGKIFTSKIEACIYATKTSKSIDWIFNDEIFSSYNWSDEPEHSLDYYYDKRARELREKYDYIVISYSGGADSHNLLQSFLRQNLFVDELVVNVFEKSNNIYVKDPNITDNWNYAAEYSLQIYPRLDEIRNQSPRTKINVVDMSDAVFDSLRKAGDASWIIDKKEVLNVSGVTRYNYVWFKDIKKKFDKDKKIALILGNEKPMTLIKDDKFYVLFYDVSANISMAQEHLTEHPNAKVEMFYWNPDCCDMICKQAHVIKKWLEMNPQMKPIWTPKTRAEFNKNLGLYHHSILRTLVYSTWNTSWFQTRKGRQGWYNEIDTWFHKLYSDTPEYGIWKEGLNYVETNAAPYVYKDEFGMPAGLNGFNKMYLVDKIKP